MTKEEVASLKKINCRKTMYESDALKKGKNSAMTSQKRKKERKKPV